MDRFLSELDDEESLVVSPPGDDQEEHPEDRAQRLRHGDDSHNQEIKHGQDLHQQHMKHRDDLHDQHKRHREEAHKHNMDLAKHNEWGYAPAHYAYDDPSVASPVGSGGSTSNSPGTSSAGGSTGAPA